MIEHFGDKIDAELKCESGRIFYSGRAAFSSPADLYLLGYNPGGDPSDPAHAQETVGSHTHAVLTQLPDRWSAYKNESWENNRPGAHGMQPRVLHLLRRLGRDPHETPASNLIFVRSHREETLSGGKKLADRCWPFHEAVIAGLSPKVIVCFGKKAGEHVGRRLKAERWIKGFTETNDRHWRSDAYRADGGPIVITVTHPSIVDWTNPEADPTPLIEEMLAKAVAPELRVVP
jgi:hypothetical protein